MKKLLPFISVASAAAIMATGCVFVGSQHPKNMSTDPRQPVIIHGDVPSADEDIIEKTIPPMNQNEVTQNLDGIKNGVVKFNQKTIPSVLSGSNGNAIYAPVCMYQAASILAGASTGDTQEQLVNFLETDDLDAQQKGAQTLLMLNSANADSTVSLANSLWIDKKFQPNKDALTQLSRNYNALIYTGDVSSDKAQNAMRTWVDNKSNGMLDPSNLALNPDALTVASLIYTDVKWAEPFEEKETKNETFHLKKQDVKIPMMHQSYPDSYVYYGDSFSEFSIGMQGGSMVFFLPDEGKTTDDVLNSKDFAAYLESEDNLKPSELSMVNLTLPKFELQTIIDLSGMLNKFGVTDMFRPDTADFSPVIDGENIYVGDMSNITKFMIDEKGMVASSMVSDVMLIGAAPMEKPKVIDFTLDRPFVFVVYGDASNLPFFAGVITNPLERM